MIRLTIACIAVVVGTAESVQAGFILAHDASIVGNGQSAQDNYNLTQDLSTGLEWLDLTLSQNRSYNDVSSQFGVGQDYAGFRIATGAEVATFWTNAGIVSLSNNTDFTDPAIGSLLDKWGVLWGEGHNRNSDVIFSDPWSGNSNMRSLGRLSDENSGPDKSLLYDTGTNPTFAHRNHGIALVRDFTPSATSVPEPTSIAMWTLGALGLMFARRKRQQKKLTA